MRLEVDYDYQNDEEVVVAFDNFPEPIFKTTYDSSDKLPVKNAFPKVRSEFPETWIWKSVTIDDRFVTEIYEVRILCSNIFLVTTFGIGTKNV